MVFGKWLFAFVSLWDLVYLVALLALTSEPQSFQSRRWLRVLPNPLAFRRRKRTLSSSRTTLGTRTDVPRSSEPLTHPFDPLIATGLGLETHQKRGAMQQMPVPDCGEEHRLERIPDVAIFPMYRLEW